MSGDARFAYVIAFSGRRFAMVRHRERAWEMPGGRLEQGESFEQAAEREFSEETGMGFEPVGSLPVQGGMVVVGLAHSRCCGSPRSDEVEEVRLFESLPGELSFPLVEYQSMLVQALTMVESFKRGKGIDGPASPLAKPVHRR